jgi:hypothetical protein
LFGTVPMYACVAAAASRMRQAAFFADQVALGADERTDVGADG